MTAFEVETDRRLQVLDVTDPVEDAIPSDASGAVTVCSRHTTAGVRVNEAEPRLMEDLESFLASVVDDDGWAHDALDGNADSHLRTMLVGASATVPVSNGAVDLGRWQSVLLVECDGPRTRTVEVRA